jgi:hypothetical protein
LAKGKSKEERSYLAGTLLEDLYFEQTQAEYVQRNS